MMEEEGVFGLRGLSRDGDGDGGWGMERGISKEEFNQHRGFVKEPHGNSLV